MRRRIAVLALLLLLCVIAHADVDLDRRGSIAVRIHDGATPVPNAVLQLYRVGEPRIENYNLVFDLSPAFAGSGADLYPPNDPALALQLSAYAAKLSPDASAISNASGRVKFDELHCGLYLIKQAGYSKKSDYSELSPFVLSVPMTQDSEWVYELSAEPKVSLRPKPTPKPDVTPPPSDGKLPQTGLLLLPVIALAGGGTLLFILGWALVFSSKRKNRDA